MKQKPEKKAYWVQKTHLLRPDEYKCSACGHMAKKAFQQCPACGSVMSKTKYDPSWVDEMEMKGLYF